MENSQRTLMTDVANCSTLYPGTAPFEAARSARDAGYRNVEFWWPFRTPVPTRAEVDAFLQALDDASLSLIALNLWGGDMAAGERGVLHREELQAGHLDTVARIAEATGTLRFCNTLPGAGGPELLPQQVDRLGAIVTRLGQNGVLPLIEPLSGNPDLPVRDPWTAVELSDATGVGVLADFFHFAALEVDVEKWLGDVEKRIVPLPDHVQIADFPGRGAPGTGDAPLEKWIHSLFASGYNAHVSAEWMG